ncbi:hypothetical protein B7495_00130 [Cryobacterium sp. LW097]|uniref:outer membrane protein assembly factor BamB family protein n=1 Tax=Cryobacterium sp. LW097 TaxID=1978566 RepID=UPI000B4D1BAA|nr:PQQ-binding-like beta-propeller repeat protein [Cryobacterium sp. LW097]ASD20716.1 hypothetical protein B7495_00130 [Cryobacterium sp. LW097]
MFRATSTLPIAALVLLVALTGCTPGTSLIPESAADIAARELDEVATPDWSVDASLVGDPAAADGVVLAYAKASSGSLQVVAWDATTGEQLWADSAVTGAATVGVQASATIISDGDQHYAAYLRPGDDKDWQDLVLADLGTGTPVPLTDNRVWATSRPSSCADGTDICFTGWKQTDYDAGSLSYRFTTAGGEITPDTDVVLPDSARLIGNRVYSTNSRPPEGTEMLGSSADGEFLWERPYQDVFGEGTSSDGGWFWTKEKTTGLLIGAGGLFDASRADATEYTDDATQQRVVALDPESGESVWSLDGAEFCDYYVREEARADGKRTFCVINSGTTSVVKKADGSGFDVTHTDFDVDLVGVDVATGEIDWTLPLGGDDYNGTGDEKESTFASFSADSVRLIDGESTIVNLITGEHSDASEEAVYACSIQREPLIAMYPGTGESTSFGGGDDHQACEATGELSDTFSIGSVRMVGVDAGAGRLIVASPGALLGFTVED